MFAYDGKLWVADFSFNQISEIYSNVFAGAKKLRRIDLKENILKTIPLNSFADNGEVTYAEFSYNQISAIELLAFAGAPKLHGLQMSRNLLGNISSNLFANKIQNWSKSIFLAINSMKLIHSFLVVQ